MQATNIPVPKQQIHGKSRLEQLTKLLQGVDIHSNTKPSVILNKMRNLGPTSDSNEILRSMWLQKLPQRTREILAINTDQSLDHQTELADRLYETYEIHNYSQNVSAVATSNIEVKQSAPKVQQPSEMPQQPYELN